MGTSYQISCRECGYDRDWVFYYLNTLYSLCIHTLSQNVKKQGFVFTLYSHQQF